MKKLSSKQIRQIWLDFFSKHGHEVVPSKSLIPFNDPSLLWINSGVATLKDYFSGLKTPHNKRMTNSQKAIRTNDIESVGITARHHTFFEMLGNFSIGDYFKEEAIKLAINLIFDVFKFKKDRIFITYYEKDLETYNLWLKYGIDESHLIKGNREMNFWDVGQGPCGPDTEIFYDRGPKYDRALVGIDLLKKDIENDRYIEIWNIVFSEFNNDGNDNYSPLVQKNIDTGAGLERITAIFQDTPTNFETDSFLPIIKKIEAISGSKYVIDNYFIRSEEQIKINKNFKIIADHIRTIAVAIQDGARPSNTARGYIIRRLLRRAYRAGLELHIKAKTFLAQLIPVVAEILDIYHFDIPQISKIITDEEISFSETIKKGEELLEESIKGKDKLDFAIAFKLFETYGFPIELTRDILHEKGIQLDVSRFEEFKERHAKASRGKKAAGMKSQIAVFNIIQEKRSDFIGYEHADTEAEVIISKEENGLFYTMTNETPFYATGGGQEHDLGTIGDVNVIDVIKDKNGNNWHVTNAPVEGSRVQLSVDQVARLDKKRNHSGTHLLAAALRKVLGMPVAQSGSYNDEHKLRFDFSCEKKPTPEDYKKVEKIVNDFIAQDYECFITETSYDEAIKTGAVKLDGENYGDNVRVVDFTISKELCGGMHVSYSHLLEEFKIIKTESKGSGIYRIEAITSHEKVNKFMMDIKEKLLDDLRIAINKNKKMDDTYHMDYPDTIKDIKKIIWQVKEDNKKLKKNKSFSTDIPDIKPQLIDGKLIYFEIIDNIRLLKSKVIQLRNAFPDVIIIIEAVVKNGRLVAIGSLKYDSLAEFKERYSGTNINGTSNFTMGKV